MADDPSPVTTNGVPSAPSGSWVIDIQRGLAWSIVLVFSCILVVLVVRVVWVATSSELLALLQQGFGVLTNVVLLIVGYFFGSSKSSQSKDETQNKIVEKLTSTQPPGSPGPVAPVAAPVVVAWWSLLTEAEREAITAAAPSDPLVRTFVAASATGKANAEDLNHLVSAGLLTAERAAVIAGS